MKSMTPPGKDESPRSTWYVSWRCRRAFVWAILAATGLPAARAQDAANTRVSVPAGALAVPASKPETASVPSPLPNAKQLREADDAYLEGARQVDHRNYAAAEEEFAKAIRLNPNDRDYALALIVTRESHVTQLVQQAAQARHAGDSARADSLLEQARTLDPKNSIVTQHFPDGRLPGAQAVAAPSSDPGVFPAADLASTLAGPIQLQPTAGPRNFHLSADAQTILRSVYGAFGIKAAFDTSVNGGPQVQFDLENVGFADVTRIAQQMTRTFAVPVQGKSVLIIRDTPENRDTFLPMVEETIYLPGTAQEQLSDYANIARNVFDLRQVSASSSNGTILVRGDEKVLQELNATFADMFDGGTDVLFDVNLYEVQKTNSRNIGASLPPSAGVFSVAAEAQQLVSSNQSIINQAVAAGLIHLTGNSFTDLITEVGFLITTGTVTATQYTNLLGIFGNGLSLAGLFLGSNSSFNLLLNSSDVRTLDAVQLRGSSGQPASFRSGSRYPIITAQYTSGSSSALSSALSGLNINGTSVSSLLSKYLGSSTATVPQVQFEDLGLTLKLTPQVQHGSDVKLAVELKIEALGGQSLNSIPVLNTRSLTSTVTILPGQTAMLATLVSGTEIKSLDGLPGLSDLPGFQGTDQSREKDSDELLITITPHVVRAGAVHFASRRLLAVRTNGSGANSNPPPPQ